MIKLLIILIVCLSSCMTQKQVNDTEHKWKGNNNLEFYE
jgi:hypothetical protein